MSNFSVRVIRSLAAIAAASALVFTGINAASAAPTREECRTDYQAAGFTSLAACMNAVSTRGDRRHSRL
jgi:hypothetical protein